MFAFQVEYYVKWQGYSSDDNRWEPEYNLWEYPDLIEAYEATHIEKPDSSGSEDEWLADDDDSSPPAKIKKVTGFARGLEPEEILSA